jgi:selenocysteine lyase/cysteine desulfurase
VSLSSVQYGTGLKLNLKPIGIELKKRNVLFCVDAIQSVGICPINAEEDGIDFLMADGHKWMLGPEGLALFYVRKDTQKLLSLTEYGWHMVKNRGDYKRKSWQVAEDATRFECGSPNMLAAHALNASLGLILEVGVEKIAGMINDNIRFLCEELSKIRSIRFISNASEHRTAGILTFTIESHDAEEIQSMLMKKGVICAYRGGGIRFSPHFYTSTKTLTNAVKILNNIIN